MDRLRFVQHKGKEILLLDCSGCNTEELLEIAREGKKLIASKPAGSILTLTNVTKVHFDTEAVQTFKEFAAHNKPYVKASATVGVEGYLKIIYTVIMKFSNRTMPIFDTPEQAMDWLAEQ